jgi:hypothetical protein
MYLEFAQLCQKIYSELIQLNENENEIFLENKTTDCQCFLQKKNNDIIVCFRGTDSLNDVLYNGMIFRVSFILENVKKYPKVHFGFLSQFNSIKKKISEFFSQQKDFKNIYFIGHSLGGALATIASVFYGQHFYQKVIHGKIFINCITFGAPRVGDKCFGKIFRMIIHEQKRFVNCKDVISKIPSSIRFHHTNKKIKLHGSSDFCSYPKLENHSIESYIKNLKKKY